MTERNLKVGKKLRAKITEFLRGAEMVVTPGQHRVLAAMLEPDKAPAYRAAAQVLGVHVGTVYRHLGRVRVQHPELYEAFRVIRRYQLEDRHEGAVARQVRRSLRYFRRRNAYNYYLLHGRWPWERWYPQDSF